jgi:hypothetical protein
MYIVKKGISFIVGYQYFGHPIKNSPYIKKTVFGNLKILIKRIKYFSKIIILGEGCG